ncbi:MAG: glycosyltransferase [Anaerolineae bacterium]
MANNRLTVSVIIPTFNRSTLLREAIDSLLAQTRIPDEIIVVDDGSTDDTMSVLSQYNAPVVAVHKSNGGQPAARNAGLDKATGDLITFLDDDDSLTTDSIETRATFLEQNPAVGVVYGDIRVTDSQGNDRGLYTQISGLSTPSGNVFGAFVERNRSPIHAFMIRRPCLEQAGRFKSEYLGVEDYDLWLSAARHCRFQYLEHVMGNYRYHGNRTTVVRAHQMQQSVIAIRAEAFKYPEFAALTAPQKARIYSVHATQHFLLANMAAARSWSLLAIRTAPTILRPYLLLALALGGKRSFNFISRLRQRLRNEVAATGT